MTGPVGPVTGNGSSLDVLENELKHQNSNQNLHLLGDHIAAPVYDELPIPFNGPPSPG